MTEDMTKDMTKVRIAENQSRFREANEQIEAAADRMHLVDPVPFLCECPRPECTELLRASLDEYEEIRQHPRRFLTAPGHQDIAVETGAGVVVDEVEGRYVIVEKVGVAGEIAAERYDELSQ
jgi:hypothetical protein